MEILLTKNSNLFSTRSQIMKKYKLLGRFSISILLSILILLMAACSPSSATSIPQGNSSISSFKASMGKLTFAGLKNSGDQYEIFTLDLVSNNLVQVTKNGFADISPSWSPDGKKIIYSSNVNATYALFSMDADGTNQNQIHQSRGLDETQPVWSSDGARIAYQSNASGQMDIYVLTLNSNSQPLRLTVNTAQNTQPAWSPDGAKIAYVSNNSSSFNIYIMNADGTNETRLTKDLSYDSSPVWSPDGKQIAFISRRDPDKHFQLFIINTDGSSEKQLTNGDDTIHSPAWSPDNKTIAFIASSTSENRLQVFDISSQQILNVDSSLYDYAGLSWTK